VDGYGAFTLGINCVPIVLEKLSLLSIAKEVEDRVTALTDRRDTVVRRGQAANYIIRVERLRLYR
jgi:hypothetical protein